MAGVSLMAVAVAAVMEPSAGFNDDWKEFQLKRLATGPALLFKDGEPTIADIQKTLDDLGGAIKEYREKNDARLKEIEAKGTADPITDDQLAKIDEAVGAALEAKKEMERILAESKRPGRSDLKNRFKTEAIEHRDRFVEWMRDRQDQDKIAALRGAEKAAIEAGSVKAVDTQTGGAGGHGVPEIIGAQIHEKLVDISPFRGVARVVSTGSVDYKELVDVGGESYGWVGETGTRNETDTAQLEEVAPTGGTLYAYPKATEESLQDIFFDVERWIVDRSARAFAKGEGVAFITGNGTNKPTGFLNGTPVTTGDEDSPARAFGTLQYFATGKADGFANSRVDSPAGDPGDVFLSTVYGLKSDYRANARWLMNTATAGLIRKFKDADGDYLWQAGMKMGEPNRLVGFPVLEMPDMPDIGANAFPVAFGNFNDGYLINDVAGTRLTRDEITSVGYVKFYIRKRVYGKMLNDDAIKVIKCATS